MNSSLIRGSGEGNPAPLGMTVKTKIELGDRYSAPEIYHLEISLLEVIRGQEAWKSLKMQEVSIDPPKLGMEYILARLRICFLSKARGFRGASQVFSIKESSFSVFSGDGKTEYETPRLKEQPHPKLIGTSLTVGESREGWVLFQVPEDEKRPLLSFHREFEKNVYGHWGTLWFQLYESFH